MKRNLHKISNVVEFSHGEINLKEGNYISINGKTIKGSGNIVLQNFMMERFLNSYLYNFEE